MLPIPFRIAVKRRKLVSNIQRCQVIPRNPESLRTKPAKAFIVKSKEQYI